MANKSVKLQAICTLASLCIVLGFGSSGMAAAEEKVLDLKLGDGGKWFMPTGPWRQEGDTLRPPTTREDEHLGFYMPDAFGDVEVTFEYQMVINHGDAGLILRAQDARHYYLVHFPTCGQAFRNHHFWAAISKVDNAAGWTRVIHLKQVLGVSSELDPWHRVKVSLQGDRFQVWIDGRPFGELRDSTNPRPGRVGLMAYTYAPGRPGPTFRNIQIKGAPAKAGRWNDKVLPGKNWFTILPTGGQQGMPSITRAPNGNLLMTITTAKQPTIIAESGDNGKSWSKLVELPANMASASLFTTRDKRLIMQTAEPDALKLFISESADNGATWSEPKAVNMNWPEDWQTAGPYGMMIQLKDGAIMRLGAAGRKGEYPRGERGANWCIRSEDGGRSWSLHRMDNPTARMMMPIEDDGSEISAAQTLSGELVAYIRPFRSATMWEQRSGDGGRTWSNPVRGPFPGYAASLVRTASGALLAAHRLPGVGIDVSRDDGMSYPECVRAETSLWVQPEFYEVAPDLVLLVYMDNWYNGLRGQFMRVTPKRLEPVAREDVGR